MALERLDVTFAALADPTRRAILARLASGQASVHGASRAVRDEPACLISSGRAAQRRPRRLEATPLAEATAWLVGYRRFWEGSFRRLDALLDEGKTDAKKRRDTNR